jgi:hypothetical protein
MSQILTSGRIYALSLSYNLHDFKFNIPVHSLQIRAVEMFLIVDI